MDYFDKMAITFTVLHVSDAVLSEANSTIKVASIK
jgi:hypothetical protein